MIILHKKRILVALSIVAVSIITIAMENRGGSNSFPYENEKASQFSTVQTVALPVSNKTIVIDAGHGVPDEGAQSSTRNN